MTLFNHSRREQDRARRYRPSLELLEDRVTPSTGLFTEDFSDDYNPSLPGYDSFDTDPATIRPDELQILHAPTSRVTIQSNSAAPSPPHHLLLLPGTDSVSFPTSGTPGGYAVDEEVAVVAFSVSGSGSVRFEGDPGRTLFLPIFAPDWQRIVFGRDHLLADGMEIGGIRHIVFSNIEAMAVDDLTVFVDLMDINRPPIAEADRFIITPGTDQWQFAVLDNDTDADADGLRLISFTQGTHGAVEESIHPEHLYYTPFGDGARHDHFTYTIRDENGATATGTVFVAINRRPSARSLLYTRPHGSFGAFAEMGLLASAIDPDGDALTVRLFEPPERGSVEVRLDGSFTYTPFASDGRVMPDRFQVVLNDGIEDSDSFSVEIRITNEAPVALGEVIHADHGVLEPLAGTLRFSNVEGDPVSLDMVGANVDPLTGLIQTTIGTLTVDRLGFLADPTVPVPFLYFPNARELRGDDQFTFRITDIYGASTTATVEIRVPNFRPEVVDPPAGGSLNYLGGRTRLTPTGEVPATGDLFFQRLENGLNFVQHNQLAVGVDHDGDPLMPVMVTPPPHGRLEITFEVLPIGIEGYPNYDFIYTPDPGMEFLDDVQFSYRLGDGVAESDDLVFVRIERTLGEGFARSDTFFYEDDQGGILDPFLAGIQDHSPHDLSTLPGVSRDTLGIFEFTPRDLLRNDFFQFGFDPIQALDRIPGFDAHIQIMSRVGEFSAELRNQFNRTVANRQSTDIFALDETIYFFPLPGEDEPHMYEFEYRFLFEHPGMPQRFSRSTRLFIAAHKEEASDADGIADDVEADAPNPNGGPHGDGNGDGIADQNQAHVASLPSAGDGRYVTLAASAATPLVGVRSLVNPPLQDPAPDGVAFPLGFFEFQLTGLAPSESTSVTLIPPPGMLIDAYYKLVPGLVVGTYQFVEFPYQDDFGQFSGAEIINNDDGDPDTDRIVLYFSDGSIPGDQSVADGVIVDPGAPAVRHPTGGIDAYELREDSVLNTPAPGLLVNDVDPAGHSLTAVLVEGPAHGTLTLNADGSFRYTPARDFFGVDGFRYRASNGAAESDVIQVTINVTPVIDAKIDIVPGNARNLVNLRSQGVLPIAILSRRVAAGALDQFDARTVAAATIRFGDPRLASSVAPVAYKLIDLNRDGMLDLLVQFSIPAIRNAGALRFDSTAAVLTGALRTTSGQLAPFMGRDAVCILPAPVLRPIFNKSAIMTPWLDIWWLMIESSRGVPMFVIPLGRFSKM